MQQVARGRLEFIDLSLNPHSSSEDLVEQQHRLFTLQEEVQACKLLCRNNIFDNFTAERWEAMQFALAARQVVTAD
jgi:hypothetical protein